MIKTSNFDENSIFDRKCLNVDLKISSKITKQEKQTTLNKINIFFSKLHDICPQADIINNSPKPYPTLTRITKLNSQKHALYMVDDLILPCYATM